MPTECCLVKLGLRVEKLLELYHMSPECKGHPLCCKGKLSEIVVNYRKIICMFRHDFKESVYWEYQYSKTANFQFIATALWFLWSVWQGLKQQNPTLCNICSAVFSFFLSFFLLSFFLLSFFLFWLPPPFLTFIFFLGFLLPFCNFFFFDGSIFIHFLFSFFIYSLIPSKLPSIDPSIHMGRFDSHHLLLSLSPSLSLSFTLHLSISLSLSFSFSFALLLAFIKDIK